MKVGKDTFAPTVAAQETFTPSGTAQGSFVPVHNEGRLTESSLSKSTSDTQR